MYRISYLRARYSIKFKMNRAIKVAEQAMRSEISYRVEVSGIIHANWMKACESSEKHSSISWVLKVLIYF